MEDEEWKDLPQLEQDQEWVIWMPLLNEDLHFPESKIMPIPSLNPELSTVVFSSQSSQLSCIS